MHAAFRLIINAKTRCGERCRVSRVTFGVPCSASEAHLKDAFLWSEFECYLQVFLCIVLSEMGFIIFQRNHPSFVDDELLKVSLEVLYICYAGSLN